MKKNCITIFLCTIQIVFLGRCAFGVTVEKKEQVRQHIVEKRKIALSRKGLAQQWLWNGAKVVGVVALVGLAVYAFFQTSPAIAPIVPMTPILPSSNPEPLQNVPQIRSLLTKEEREKYRDISNNFGKAGSIFTLIAMINPVLLPLAIALDLGAIYYGIKIVPKPDLYPIAWDQITMVPAEMPY